MQNEMSTNKIEGEHDWMKSWILNRAMKAHNQVDKANRKLSSSAIWTKWLREIIYINFADVYVLKKYKVQVANR